MRPPDEKQAASQALPFRAVSLPLPPLTASINRFLCGTKTNLSLMCHRRWAAEFQVCDL